MLFIVLLPFAYREERLSRERERERERERDTAGTPNEKRIILIRHAAEMWSFHEQSAHSCDLNFLNSSLFLFFFFFLLPPSFIFAVFLR